MLLGKPKNFEMKACYEMTAFGRKRSVIELANVAGAMVRLGGGFYPSIQHRPPSAKWLSAWMLVLPTRVRLTGLCAFSPSITCRKQRFTRYAQLLYNGLAPCRHRLRRSCTMETIATFLALELATLALLYGWHVHRSGL